MLHDYLSLLVVFAVQVAVLLVVMLLVSDHCALVAKNLLIDIFASGCQSRAKGWGALFVVNTCGILLLNFSLLDDWGLYNLYHHFFYAVALPVDLFWPVVLLLIPMVIVIMFFLIRVNFNFLNMLLLLWRLESDYRSYEVWSIDAHGFFTRWAVWDLLRFSLLDDLMLSKQFSRVIRLHHYWLIMFLRCSTDGQLIRLVVKQVLLYQ